MTDEFTMRARLQQVAAYRELRRSVRRSGRENVVFAVVMLALAYFFHAGNLFFQVVFVLLAAGELLAGLFKWVAPSAEGLILDGLVLLAFAVFNFFLAYLRFNVRGGIDPISVFFGLFMLSGALNRFRAYGQLRRLFAERPSAEHLAWFDELVYEIRGSDPVTDPLALDLPTRPHWKAKLLGGTAFFVATSGNTVWIAGPDDFTLRREKADRGTGVRKALLAIHGDHYPEFELADASWDNYARWMAGQQPGGLPA